MQAKNIAGQFYGVAFRYFHIVNARLKLDLNIKKQQSICRKQYFLVWIIQGKSRGLDDSAEIPENTPAKMVTGPSVIIDFHSSLNPSIGIGFIRIIFSDISNKLVVALKACWRIVYMDHRVKGPWSYVEHGWPFVAFIRPGHDLSRIKPGDNVGMVVGCFNVNSRYWGVILRRKRSILKSNSI